MTSCSYIAQIRLHHLVSHSRLRFVPTLLCPTPFPPYYLQSHYAFKKYYRLSRLEPSDSSN
ncbi:hypothetical protein BDQ17DRAFT_1375515, partial [Cyathus striatus]